MLGKFFLRLGLSMSISVVLSDVLTLLVLGLLFDAYSIFLLLVLLFIVLLLIFVEFESEFVGRILIKLGHSFCMLLITLYFNAYFVKEFRFGHPP